MDMAAKIKPEFVSSANGTDGREACSKFWIAAYTRPKSEKKVASELKKNPGIEIYAPTQTIVMQWSDRKKKIDVVVIPMVIFAKVSTEDEILAIKKHPLILKVLTLPGQKKPAHIPDNQIEQLKFMLNKSDELVEFVQGNFKVLDEVKVVRGHFAGLQGVVQRTSDGQSFVIITIDLLGGAKASVNSSDLELLQTK